MVDGFGDRLLMFDNTETDSLELLRFHPSLAAIAGFEEALHERVHHVGQLPDHAFPLIVAVERLDGDGALALVSTHVPGKRLSAFFDKPGPRRGLNPSFVVGVVTQAVQALNLLQSKGDSITHSALTPERFVITTGGRVCILEHVLGSALQHLNPSSTQLWRDFGLVTPSMSSGVSLDARTDVFQLGVLALAMLLGRRLTPLDLRDRLPDLLQFWSNATGRSQMRDDRLRRWLERALQLGDRNYASAAAAYVDLRDMPSEAAASAFDSLQAAEPEASLARPVQMLGAISRLDEHRPRPVSLDVVRGRMERSPGASEPVAPVPAAQPERVTVKRSAPPRTEVSHSAPVIDSSVITLEALPNGAWTSDEAAAVPGILPAAKASTPHRQTAPSELATGPFHPPAAQHVVAEPASRLPRTAKLRPLPTFASSPWIAASLAVVAALEGAVIVTLLLRQPQQVAATAPPVGGTAIAGAPVRGPAAVPARAALSPAAPATARSERTDAIQSAAANQRSGGVRLSSPIELKVLEGERVLGSTADGVIVAKEGTHQVDLVNTALGFRMRRPLTFRTGEILTAVVTVPPGRANFNAQPWAEVLIDNRSVGETPLANLSVPLGEHEIVFRHPELGERRQTITVRADAVARVSATFER